jgi:uncharacterized membrane protein YhfC
MLYVTYPLNALLMIFLPIGLAILLAERLGGRWTVLGIGVLTFIAAQVVHLPLNYGLTVLFRRQILPAPPAAWAPLFNPVVLGLTAGLCEELARYAAFRGPLRRSHRWEDGLMLGAGHGGVEALLLGAGAGLGFLYMVASREADSPALATAVAAYWGVAWYAPLAGALERVSALVLHLGFSLLVLEAVVRRALGWLLAAIAWHAAVDAAAVFGLQHWSLASVETLVAFNAAAALVIVVALRPRRPGGEPRTA